MSAVIGFSFAVCGNGSTDGPPTYTAAIFRMDKNDYPSIFGSVPPSFTTLSSTKDELIAKVEAAISIIDPHADVVAAAYLE